MKHLEAPVFAIQKHSEAPCFLLFCTILTLKIQNSENRQLPDSSKTVEWKQFRGLDHFIIGGFIDTDLVRRGLAFGWFCIEDFVFYGLGVTVWSRVQGFGM